MKIYLNLVIKKGKLRKIIGAFSYDDGDYDENELFLQSG